MSAHGHFCRFREREGNSCRAGASAWPGHPITVRPFQLTRPPQDAPRRATPGGDSAPLGTSFAKTNSL